MKESKTLILITNGITAKFNFNCPYCNKFTGILGEEPSLENVKETISKLSQNNGNLKYVHFTGGEPTVRKDLPEIVQYAKSVNANVGVSTNGSANIELYKQLVDCGVELFSISLDAKNEDINSSMSGVNNIFNKVVSNIQEISKTCKVTIGTVINDANFNDAENIIKFISDLGVSDIRVGTATQFNKMINLNLPQNILDKHPILNYRINNFKSGKNMRGVCGTDCKHCFMTLDDISIVNNYHFPCMVYAREKGSPIGSVSNTEKMKSERIKWVANHDCTKDPICQKYCMDFKIDYNNKFNKINKNKNKILTSNF